MTRLTFASILSATVAVGCASSPPMHYYTLTEVPSNSGVSAPASTIPVRLDRVTIPTELDRAQIVRRVDATRLQILETDRWAAPLEDMIRRVLSVDLAQRLPSGLVANPNEPSVGEKRQSLSVDIQEFYADQTCAVILRAAWVLKQPDSQSARGNAQAHVPASGNCAGAATLPAAMSQALGQLSDRIATAVAHEAAGPAGAAAHNPPAQH